MIFFYTLFFLVLQQEKLTVFEKTDLAIIEEKSFDAFFNERWYETEELEFFRNYYAVRKKFIKYDYKNIKNYVDRLNGFESDNNLVQLAKFYIDLSYTYYISTDVSKSTKMIKDLQNTFLKSKLKLPYFKILLEELNFDINYEYIENENSKNHLNLLDKSTKKYARNKVLKVYQQYNYNIRQANYERYLGDIKKVTFYLEQATFYNKKLKPVYERKIRLYLEEMSYYIEYPEFGSIDSLRTKLEAAFKGNFRNHYFLARYYSLLGNFFNGKTDYQRSIKHLKSALNNYNRVFRLGNLYISYLYNEIGFIYYRLNLPHLALPYFQNDLKITKGKTGGKAKDLIAIFSNIAKVYIKMGYTKLAKEYCLKAIKIAQNFNDLQSLSILYNHISVNYTREKKIDKAIDYQIKSNLTLKALRSKNKSTDYYNYSHLSNLYRKKGEYKKSQFFWKVANNIVIETLGKNNYLYFDSMIDYIRLKIAQGELDSAKFYCKMAKSIALKKNYSQKHILRLMGDILLREKKYYEAIKTYNTAIQKSKDPYYDMEIKLDLAKIYSNLNQHELSINICKKILLEPDLNHQGFFNEILIFDIRSFLMNELYIKSKTDNKAMLDAYVLFKEADSLFHSLLLTYNKKTRNQQKHRYYGFYQNAFLLVQKLYKSTKNKKYLDELYILVEKAKNLNLLFSKVENISFDEKFEQYFIKQDYLKKKLFQFRKDKKSDIYQQLETDLSITNLKVDSIKKVLKTDIELKKYAYIDKNIIKETMGGLDKDAIVLNYFFTKNELNVLMVTNNQIKVFKQEIDRNSIKKLKNNYQSIKLFDLENHLKLSRFAHQLLIKPVEKEIEKKKKLIIIPDASLSFLPFESLKNNKGYLIEFYEIQYAFSSKAVKEKNDKRKYRFLGIAPVFDKKFQSYNFNKYRSSNIDLYEQVRSMYSLPHSEKEVNEIAELFNEKNFESNRLVKNEATEIKSRKLMEDADFLHFATHSFSNQKFEDFSWIAFSQSNVDTNSVKNDGFLFYSEIDRLNVNPYLVTLSSCESGAGKFMEGNGVFSLGRAFYVAGARNVIQSLWKVQDKTSYKFMLKFYQNYFKHKENISKALRETKLSFIKDPKFSFPFHWAAFVHYGDI